MLFYDRRFANNAQFVFLLFDQFQRHSTNSKVSIKLRNGKQREQNFVTLVNNEQFQNDLSYAVENKQSPTAKRLMNCLLPMVKIVGTTIPWSPLQRQSALPRLYGMCHFFSLPFIFFTISPSTRNSPLAIRMCLKDNGENFKLPPIHVRSRMLSLNPVAAASLYDRLMKSVFAIIAGIPLDHFTERRADISRLLKEFSGNYISVYGNLKAGHMVTEAQGSGALHGHGH